jgi:hypothetical protein
MFAAYVQADAIVKGGVSQLIHDAFVVPTNFPLALYCIVDAVEMLLYAGTLHFVEGLYYIYLG